MCPHRPQSCLPGSTDLVIEICEIADHPWFLGCQSRLEFKSKRIEPHPALPCLHWSAKRLAGSPQGDYAVIDQ